MTLQPNDLQTALDVKRGQRKLRDLPDEERARVATVMRRTSDAQFSDMARAQEQPRHRHFRYAQPRR